MALQLLLLVGCLVMQIYQIISQWKSSNRQGKNSHELREKEATNHTSSSSSRTAKSNPCFMVLTEDDASSSNTCNKKTKAKRCSKKSLKRKKKTKSHISWSDTATSSASREITQQPMAFATRTSSNSSEESKDEVNSSKTKDHDYEELQEAFSALFDQYQKLSLKNKQLRKQMKIQDIDCKCHQENVINLRQENSDLRKQLDDISKDGCSKCIVNSHLVCNDCKTFEEKVSFLENENSVLKNKVETVSSNASKAEALLKKPCESCKNLSQKLSTVENNLAKFTKAKTDLNSFLQVQRTMNDKTGLGFKNVSKRGKQQFYQRPKHNSALPSITCNYCMKRGHISNDCMFRKYEVPKGTYAWVKKAPIGITNFQGPKTIWVPKSS